jgi:hypothetical protein
MKSNKEKKGGNVKKILSNFSNKPVSCIDSEGKVSDLCVVSISKRII